MDSSTTLIRIRLYHSEEKNIIFRDIPQHLLIHSDNVFIGRGINCQLKFRDVSMSRCHACLEPYLEKGNPSLKFSFKNLSLKRKIRVNGVSLQYLQQIPLSAINRITFCGIQMEMNVEPGISLEKFQCHTSVSESPLFHVAEAEEADEVGMMCELEL
ncbi:TRAF-interacting protein with FHA domain-containing protein B [Ambystoma mexicanum]|uniref:TRAF-interacting protein with FHA domain-containing protein B n=1 Tax=Ambystoma mexicanum TaxID=8296 RepID=UPI0037E86211